MKKIKNIINALVYSMTIDSYSRENTFTTMDRHNNIKKDLYQNNITTLL